MTQGHGAGPDRADLWPLRRAPRRHRRGDRPAAVRADHHLRLRPEPVPHAAGKDRFGLADRQPDGTATTCRTSRPTTSTRPSPTATSASRPAPTILRWPCTRSATSPGSRSAGPRSRWSQLGFGRTSSTSTTQTTARNLFGFKDGTANLKAEEPDLLDSTSGLPPTPTRRPAGWPAAPTVVARRINMTIETWDRQPLREQETGDRPDQGRGRAAVGRHRVQPARLRTSRAATTSR